MKPEPLKNKIIKGNDFGFKDLIEVKNVKLAVEWLKKEDWKIYKQISKLTEGMDGGNHSKVIAKFIRLNQNKDKAFEDVVGVIKIGRNVYPKCPACGAQGLKVTKLGHLWCRGCRTQFELERDEDYNIKCGKSMGF